MVDKDGVRRRGPWDVVAAVVVCAQVTLAVVLTGIYVTYAVIDDAAASPQWLSLAIVAALIAAGLGFAVRGWWHARHWSRSVILTWQVIQLGVALAWPDLNPAVRGVAVLSAVLVIVAVIDQARRWGERDFAR